MRVSTSIALALLGWSLLADSRASLEPGYLDFDNLPETNFSCEAKVIGGYYADVETGCQMFHVCTIGQKGEVTDIKFLCLNGTVFDQETRVCERIDEVDCSRSESFFDLNLELYGNRRASAGCEDDCATDEYDVTASPTTTTTTAAAVTTTAVTTTTTTRPVTTTETVGLQALLALHDAFRQSLVQPRFPSARPRPADYVHGYPRHRFPATSSNYHRFQSGDIDIRFSHGYEDFQSLRRLSSPSPSPSPFVSVVTSTSTSTSVRAAGEEEYRDGDDPFFGDVPRLRKERRKREDGREEKRRFLMNLLGSMDMAAGERKRLAEFFRKEEPEMEKDARTMQVDAFLEALHDKIGEVDLEKDCDEGQVEGGTSERSTEAEGGERRKRETAEEVVKPVTEVIEDDLTTTEYRRTRTRTRNRGRKTEPEPNTRPRTRFDNVRGTTTERTTTRSSQRTRARSEERIVPVRETSVERNRRRRVKATTATTEATTATTGETTHNEETGFSCQGKVKGGFYADTLSDCRGFFICSQGEIDGPLLKSHFWCGTATKFNQRSRTCQADYIVECSVSDRYYHLNNDFLVPETEEELKGDFEPAKLT